MFDTLIFITKNNPCRETPFQRKKSKRRYIHYHIICFIQIVSCRDVSLNIRSKSVFCGTVSFLDDLYKFFTRKTTLYIFKLVSFEYFKTKTLIDRVVIKRENV